MDQIALVERQIVDGQRLVEHLVQSGFEVTAAGWLRESDSGHWSLYIATPRVELDGQIEACRRVDLAGGEFSEPLWVDRWDVRVIGASDRTTKDMLNVQAEGSSRIPTHYTGGRLGDVAVEEAYIYPPLQSVPTTA